MSAMVLMPMSTALNVGGNRQMAQMPENMVADNTVYSVPVDRDVDYAYQMNNYTQRTTQRRVQVLSYLCSKQPCIQYVNCTLKAMSKSMLNCIFAALGTTDNEINVKYKFSKRLRFFETAYTNLQLLLFAQASVTNLAAARNFTNMLGTITHNHADLARLMLSDAIFENKPLANDSSGTMFMERLKKYMYHRAAALNATDDDQTFDRTMFQKVFNDLAKESPWYCALIIAFLIKLLLMYAFHIHQFGKWCVNRKRRGGTGAKKRRNPNTNNHHADDGKDMEMITFPVIDTTMVR